MIIQLQAKPTRNGNILKLIINHDKKTFKYGYYISAFTNFEIITTQERIKEYKTILSDNGYIRID